MFKKIHDAKDLEALLRAWHGKRATTNFFLTEDIYLSMIKQCAVMRFENGCYLIFEKQNHYDFYFFLQKGTLPVAVPQMPKPLVLEQVCLERKGQEPKASFWEAVGFVPYLERKRLIMPLQDGISATSAVQFATSSQADTILEMMQNMFEPYTSALPTKKELLASIVKKEVLVAQEHEQLLGFLRYGAEKKVSVLWQIAVSKQARGKGIGKMLVKHWIWQVKDDALRCQLWVRTDNQAAQRMYEMLGFLPDGRIAPVMIKKEEGNVENGKFIENFSGNQT